MGCQHRADVTYTDWTSKFNKRNGVKVCIYFLENSESNSWFRDNTLVSGNADSTVKIWDIATGYLIRTLEGKFKHEVKFIII